MKQLTDKQLEAIAHLANGLKHSEICEQMFISRNPLTRHLKLACLKLEAANNVNLVAICILYCHIVWDDNTNKFLPKEKEPPESSSLSDTFYRISNNLPSGH